MCTKFEVELAAAFVGTDFELKALAARLADMAVNQLMPPDSDIALVDEVTGLAFPPAARCSYSECANKYGHKLNVDEFIEREWGDYAKHTLLYSNHLRITDLALYQAIGYQARKLLMPKEKYQLALGIMARSYIFQPPVGYERQAEVLRRVWFAQRLPLLVQVGRSRLPKPKDIEKL